jgi:phenolic acid decarboxylase
MLEYRDFVPKIIAQGPWQFPGIQMDHTYETLESAATAAGRWMKDSGVRVLQIETVVLPNIWLEEGSADVSLPDMPKVMNRWLQFVRVWFDPELPPPYR